MIAEIDLYSSRTFLIFSKTSWRPRGSFITGSTLSTKRTHCLLIGTAIKSPSICFDSVRWMGSLRDDALQQGEQPFFQRSNIYASIHRFWAFMPVYKYYEHLCYLSHVCHLSSPRANPPERRNSYSWQILIGLLYFGDDDHDNCLLNTGKKNLC